MSFNDLLTVLLTFFILLVSVSYLQMDRVQDLSASAVRTFGADRPAPPSGTVIGTLSAIEGIRVNPVAGGVEVVLPESLVYPSGSAEILRRDSCRPGRPPEESAAAIRIEGHTDESLWPRGLSFHWDCRSSGAPMWPSSSSSNAASIRRLFSIAG
jgi:flagellar motor protein MotB